MFAALEMFDSTFHMLEVVAREAQMTPAAA
jgi:hypothetical protein